MSQALELIVDASDDFLKKTAQHLIDWAKNNPIQMARAKIFVPTNRMAKILRKKLSSGSVFIPKIFVIGSVHDDEVLAFCGHDVSFKKALSNAQAQALVVTCLNEILKSDDFKDLGRFFSLNTCLKIGSDFLKAFELFVWEEKVFSKNIFADVQLAKQSALFLNLFEELYQTFLFELKKRDVVTYAMQQKYYLEKLTDDLSTAKLRDMVVCVGILPQFLTYKKLLNVLDEKGCGWIFHSRSLSVDEKDFSQNVDVVRCDTQFEEVRVVANRIRCALDRPSISVMVITPSLIFSKMLCEHLKKWEIVADNSAGTPIRDHFLGNLLCLILKVLKSNDFALSLFELLKHPWNSLNKDHVFLLQEHVFRGVILKNSFDGFFEKLRKNQDVFDLCSPLLKEIEELFKVPAKVSCYEWFLWHEKALSFFIDGENNPLFHDKTLQDLYLSIKHHFKVIEPFYKKMSFHDYALLFDEAIDSFSYRNAFTTHPRLSILGPLEARFQHADVVLFCNMQHDLWGTLSDNYFMTPLVIKKLALTYRDFYMQQVQFDLGVLLSKKHIFVSYADADHSGPVLVHPWVFELERVAKKQGIDFSKRALMWKKTTYFPKSDQTKLVRPQIKLLKQQKPKHFSATQIQMLIDDPYSFFASNILNLRKKEDINAPLDGRFFGNFVHKLLDYFIKNKGHEKEGDKSWHDSFLSATKTFLAPIDDLKIRFFMNERIKNIADDFLKDLTSRIQKNVKIHTEKKGITTLLLNGDNICFEARADRIDVGSNDITLIDYKTGTIPSQPQMERFAHWQLFLEALILAKDGFKDVGSLTDDVSLCYFDVSGKEKSIGKTILKRNLDEVSRIIEEKLKELLSDFYDDHFVFDVKDPYDFLHLSRKEEWQNNYD